MLFHDKAYFVHSFAIVVHVEQYVTLALTVGPAPSPSFDFVKLQTCKPDGARRRVLRQVSLVRCDILPITLDEQLTWK